MSNRYQPRSERRPPVDLAAHEGLVDERALGLMPTSFESDYVADAVLPFFMADRYVGERPMLPRIDDGRFFEEWLDDASAGAPSKKNFYAHCFDIYWDLHAGEPGLFARPEQPLVVVREARRRLAAAAPRRRGA